MQAFASPVKNRTSYPIDLAGAEGFWATYPLAGKCGGAEVDGTALEPPLTLSPVDSDVYLSTTAPVAEGLDEIFSCQRPGQRLSAQGLSACKHTDAPELTML